MAEKSGDSSVGVIAGDARSGAADHALDLSQQAYGRPDLGDRSTTAGGEKLQPQEPSSPASTWDRLGDTVKIGIEHIPQGIANTLRNPADLIENSVVSIGLGAAAKAILPETGVLGKAASIGLGLYMGVETAIPGAKALYAGAHAETMAGIEHAGGQLGDSIGSLAVNAPIGYLGYKVGGKIGEHISASPRFEGLNSWKTNTLEPFNDALTARARTVGSNIGSFFSIKSLSDSGDGVLRGRVEKTEQATSPSATDPALTLPERYKPIQETFSGTTVPGISRTFLENLKTDDKGTYYGAGARYPDIMADPAMADYINAHNKLTMSRIDPQIYAEQLAMESKTGGAFGKLPDGWDTDGTAKNLQAIDARDGDAAPITIGSKTYQLTDKGAPNRQLTVSDASAPGGTKVLIPESKDFEMQQVIHVDANGSDKFAVVGSHDGASILNLYDGNGTLQNQIPLPGYGTLHDVKPGATSSQLQFLYDTPIHPPQALTVDLADNSHSLSQMPGYEFDSDKFQTDKLMVPYTDIDGKPQIVPAFVSYPKDLVKDGNNNAIMEIYGGFDVGPQYLGYMANNAVTMQRGGVAVAPVLPGDGGLGANNYHEGLLKGITNNVAAMSAIVAKLHDLGLSSPDTTGVYGRSNGGMEVAMLLNNRPDLVGAAVSESPVISLFDSPVINPDTGRYWDPEFGDPSKPKDVGWMRAVDPLNNVSADVKYPPTAVFIGTIDGIVNTGNGITYANARQALPGNGETLLYSRLGEGHDPTSLSLQTAYLWDRLSQNAKKPPAAGS